MKPVTFCERCRGIEVGWNRRYATHVLLCLGGIGQATRVFAYAASAVLILSVFPRGGEMSPIPERPASDPQLTVASDDSRIHFSSDPTIDAIEDLLGRHSRVAAVDRARIARAVVASANRHDVDPFLIVSILLVESSGNRFAISGRDAVGIMQIHVPTWGSLVDAEGINLFLIEDNIDLGTRILKDYTARYGLWDGVSRYLGANAATEQSRAYVARVQGIYGDRMAD